MEINRPPTKTRFSSKSLTSFCIAGLLIVMGVSGVILYASPRCRDAYDAGWTAFGLDKDTWDALHINASLLFLIAAAVHLVLNWKVFWSYIRRRSQQGLHRKAELALASLALGVVVTGTVAGWSPFQKPLDWRFDIKSYWSELTRRLPQERLAELTLAELASQYGQSAEELIQTLDAKGYGPVEPTQTVQQVASRKGVSPRTVLRELQPQLPMLLASAPGRGRGGWRSGRGSGAGRYEGGRGPWWLALSVDRADSDEGEADAQRNSERKSCDAERGHGGCRREGGRGRRGERAGGRCSASDSSGGDCDEKKGDRCAGSESGRSGHGSGRYGRGGGRHGGGHGRCGRGSHEWGGGHGARRGQGRGESCRERKAERQHGEKRACRERMGGGHGGRSCDDGQCSRDGRQPDGRCESDPEGKHCERRRSGDGDVCPKESSADGQEQGRHGRGWRRGRGGRGEGLWQLLEEIEGEAPSNPSKKPAAEKPQAAGVPKQISPKKERPSSKSKPTASGPEAQSAPKKPAMKKPKPAQPQPKSQTKSQKDHTGQPKKSASANVT
ncbi:MAG: DUF4405 domain-containing protein [Planctomycetes bacterium]|nr:DUF4405 domain-containing protein [Planctomycetota bacterium]